MVDSLTYAGNIENISDLVDAKRVQFVRADIVSAEAMRGLFQTGKFELVFHLAAESHVDRSIAAADEFVRTNVLGTQILLDASLQHKVGRFVHISTDEVYGSLGETGYFTETTPLDPTSPYAASKASSDLMVLACAKTHHFDAVVTRCTNNYGPYQFPEKLIPLFVTNALEDKKLPLYGDGMNVRHWLHVRDHAAALLLVAESGKPGEVYNIGGGQDSELTNRAVTETILRILGKPASLVQSVGDRPAHDRRYAIDYSKLQDELGWQPKVNFRDGIAETVAWYQNNTSWWTRIKTGEYQRFYELNYGRRGAVGA